MVIQFSVVAQHRRITFEPLVIKEPPQVIRMLIVMKGAEIFLID